MSIVNSSPSSGDNHNNNSVNHHHHHLRGKNGANGTKLLHLSNGTVNLSSPSTILSPSYSSFNLSSSPPQPPPPSSSNSAALVGSSSSILLTITTTMSTTLPESNGDTVNQSQYARTFSIVETESTINNFFGINDRDVPILIGAAAGALGLLLIILAAVLAWYCCQYGIRRQRSAYCLDEENEKWASCSNLGSGIFADNDSVIFTGMENLNKQNVRGHNIKRSLSAQLHMVNLNFTKKRANRMRNDSAAAIALNRSGATPTHQPYLTKETDCLVDNDSLIDNEAVVVYDERTVL